VFDDSGQLINFLAVKRMETVTVRNSVGWMVFAAWPIVIGFIGLVMALQSRGHWSLGAALIWGMLGVINVVYMTNIERYSVTGACRKLAF
jgi:formate hydrogenlyase subunit 3/multisubunit Na+/H+ antiporter MnhD subunit